MVVGAGSEVGAGGGTPVVMVDGVWETWAPHPALPPGNWMVVVRAGSGPPRTPVAPVNGVAPQLGPPEPALQIWALPAWLDGTRWRSWIAARWSQTEMDAPQAQGELALVAAPLSKLTRSQRSPPQVTKYGFSSSANELKHKAPNEGSTAIA